MYVRSSVAAALYAGIVTTILGGGKNSKLASPEETAWKFDCMIVFTIFSAQLTRPTVSAGC